MAIAISRRTCAIPTTKAKQSHEKFALSAQLEHFHNLFSTFYWKELNMAFNAQQGGEGVDPELARFINLETQRQKFSQLVYSLTDTCWDKCIADMRLGTRLESKTETCLVNCVERFIDTTNFIVNRLESVKSSPGSKLGLE